MGNRQTGVLLHATRGKVETENFVAIERHRQDRRLVVRMSRLLVVSSVMMMIPIDVGQWLRILGQVIGVSAVDHLHIVPALGSGHVVDRFSPIC